MKSQEIADIAAQLTRFAEDKTLSAEDLRREVQSMSASLLFKAVSQLEQEESGKGSSRKAGDFLVRAIELVLETSPGLAIALLEAYSSPSNSKIPGTAIKTCRGLIQKYGQPLTDIPPEEDEEAGKDGEDVPKEAEL